ncbi:MAG: hypothetical protein CME70_03785 [Halobacteriovorax sp.]|nr:hypothetical protein [Halobacteriovorax sp.]|tara:strand:+ start:168255 stop:169550 length:1296 start_codon:yes stop_codon:yes gene_type:complete
MVTKWILTFSLLLSFSLSAQVGEDGVARVLRLRGEVSAVSKEGVKSKLKKLDWLKEGVRIETGSRSFVRIALLDKSQINIGPNSALVVAKSGINKKSVINLMRGMLRTKVMKDPNKSGDTAKSKFYIRTKTAAMAVRGTDFQVIFNERTQITNLLTFEGEVVFVKSSEREFIENIDYERLEKQVNQNTSVPVRAGQFSIALVKKQRVSLPTRINPIQLDALEKNKDLKFGNKKPRKLSDTNIQDNANVLPGLTSKEVTSVDSNIEKQLKDSLSEKLKEELLKDKKFEQNIEKKTEGFNNKETGEFAPSAGGFVDLDTGHYIAPPEDARYDEVTKMYIPPKNFGTIDLDTGEYIPPKNEDGEGRGPDSEGSEVIDYNGHSEDTSGVSPEVSEEIQEEIAAEIEEQAQEAQDEVQQEVEQTSTRLEVNVTVEN